MLFSHSISQHACVTCPLHSLNIAKGKVTKQHRSLGSCSGRWCLEGGGPQLCLPPETLAKAFSHSILFVAFSKQSPLKSVASFPLSVSSSGELELDGLTQAQATLFLSSVMVCDPAIPCHPATGQCLHRQAPHYRYPCPALHSVPVPHLGPAHLRSQVGPSHFRNHLGTAIRDCD